METPTHTPTNVPEQIHTKETCSIARHRFLVQTFEIYKLFIYIDGGWARLTCPCPRVLAPLPPRAHAERVALAMLALAAERVALAMLGPHAL